MPRSAASAPSSSRKGAELPVKSPPRRPRLGPRCRLRSRQRDGAYSPRRVARDEDAGRGSCHANEDWVQHMLQYVTMKTLSDTCKWIYIPNRYEAEPKKLTRIVGMDTRWDRAANCAGIVSCWLAFLLMAVGEGLHRCLVAARCRY